MLAGVLLGLVALSYVMLAHMLRSWGDGVTNASAAPRAAMRGSAAGGGASGGEVAGGGGGARAAASCAEYGPVHEEIDGMTALMRASSQGDEGCATELIAAGASVDARDSQEGFTALLMASAMGARDAPRPPSPPSRPVAAAARPPLCTPSLLFTSARPLGRPKFAPRPRALAASAHLVPWPRALVQATSASCDGCSPPTPTPTLATMTAPLL